LPGFCCSGGALRLGWRSGNAGRSVGTVRTAETDRFLRCTRSCKLVLPVVLGKQGFRPFVGACCSAIGFVGEAEGALHELVDPTGRPVASHDRPSQTWGIRGGRGSALRRPGYPAKSAGVRRAVRIRGHPARLQTDCGVLLSRNDRSVDPYTVRGPASFTLAVADHGECCYFSYST